MRKLQPEGKEECRVKALPVWHDSIFVHIENSNNPTFCWYKAELNVLSKRIAEALLFPHVSLHRSLQPSRGTYLPFGYDNMAL